MSEDVTSATPPTDPVGDTLREHGADDETVSAIKDNLGVETLEDLALLTEQDLTGSGLKIVQARKLLTSLKPTKGSEVDVSAANTMAFDLLPDVPDDVSWLSALRTGGVLKVDQSTVISAIRAALATRVGLYDIPSKLVDAMEAFADSNDEQVDPEFFKLRKQLTRRSYGDIFEAIDGLDGGYVNETRKKELFRRVDANLWPAISAFSQQLKSWMEAWQQQSMNPMLTQQLLSAALTGNQMVLPPGTTQAPDTGVLRDASAEVNDAINKVFAGTGVQIAAALAYEASEIRKSLENPRLPALIGAANREQMLKMLNVAVSANYTRLETSLTRFVLATMQVEDQASGNEELQYFGALSLLSSQIPWDSLNSGGRQIRGIGGRGSQL